MEYAKSLVKRKAGKNKTAAVRQEQQEQLAQAHSDENEWDADEEESWTFIGSDEPDPDVTTKRLSEMHAVAARGNKLGRGLGQVPAAGGGRKSLGSRVMSPTSAQAVS